MSDQPPKTRHLLRLVSPPQPEVHDPAVQLDLFGGRRTAFVLFTANLSEQGFLEALGEARAECVVDARTFPRFDFGRLTRRQVFAHFEQDRTTYKTWLAPSKDEAILPILIAAKDPKAGRRLSRLLVLCDDRHQMSAIIDRWRSYPEAAEAWSLRILNTPALLQRG